MPYDEEMYESGFEDPEEYFDYLQWKEEFGGDCEWTRQDPLDEFLDMIH